MIKRIDKKSRFYDIYAIDTEDNGKGKVYCAVLYDGKRFFDYYDMRKLRKKLEDMEGIVFCCNLEYDLVNVFGKDIAKLNVYYNGVRIVFAKLGKLRFYDTLNHFQISVKGMGEIIGLPKLSVGNKQDIKYCRRDTEIVYKFMKAMQSKYHNFDVEYKSTIAANSLDLFRRYYLSFNIKNVPKGQQRLAIKSYYGGRCEIFKTEVIGKIFYYDVNSLYPYMMLNKLPNPNYFKEEINLDKEGITTCKVYVPDSYIPSLPYRDNGKLIFPTGNLRGTWCNCELRNAMQYGVKILNVYEGFIYPHTYHFFKNYIDTIYSYKKNATNEVDRFFYKKLLNSLYGKFAQKGSLYKLVKSRRQGRLFFYNFSFKRIASKKSYQYTVIWSSYITAMARVYLHNLMMRWPDDMIYTDTDSLITFAQYPTGDDIGQLRLEGIYDKGIFKLPKLYYLGADDVEYIKAKGIPREHALEYFFNDMVEFEKPVRLRESLIQNTNPNVWIKVKKELRHTYNKRIILKKDTRPIFKI